MQAAPTQVTLAMARLLAEAHADTGLAQFNELQRVTHDAKLKGEKAGFVEMTGRAVPAATSLSLALELELKVLHYQHFERYPETHDLNQICSVISRESTDLMVAKYQELIARPNQLEVIHFSVAAASSAEAFPPHEVPDVSTFHAALAHVGNAFVSWRYVYEKLEVPQHVGIHFWALLCLIEAVHDAIVQYKGNARVTIG